MHNYKAHTNFPSLITLCFFLLTSTSLAKGPDRWLVVNGKRELIKKVQKDCRVSNSAVCAKNNCMAQKIIGKVRKAKTKFKLEANGKNPTSTFCESFKGKPLIGKDKDGNEVSLCQFKDSSFIYGWDFFNLAYK